MAMQVARNLQRKSIWHLKVNVLTSKWTMWKVEVVSTFGKASEKHRVRWRSYLWWLTTCGQQFKNARSEAWMQWFSKFNLSWCHTMDYSTCFITSGFVEHIDLHLFDTENTVGWCGMCGQGLFINLWPTLKPFNLMPALCKWETFMIFADASDFSPPLLCTDVVRFYPCQVWHIPGIFFSFVRGVDHDGTATSLAFGNSNVKLFVTAPISIAAVRYLPPLACWRWCWSLLVSHGHVPHIPSDTWHPRRTVEAASGQYVVLDCTSGYTENSTAYLAPWMKFRYSFWILSNHHFLSKVQTHTLFNTVDKNSSALNKTITLCPVIYTYLLSYDSCD